MVTLATQKSREAKRAKLAAIGIALHEKPRPGRSKYHNVAAIYKGERYDSAGEAERAQQLDLLLAASEICYWDRPKPIVLLDAPKARDRVTYKPDFYVIPKSGFSWYEDYKGSTVTETDAFRIKVKMWKQKIPFELRVVYKDGTQKVVATGNEVSEEKHAAHG